MFKVGFTFCPESRMHPSIHRCCITLRLTSLLVYTHPFVTFKLCNHLFSYLQFRSNCMQDIHNLNNKERLAVHAWLCWQMCWSCGKCKSRLSQDYNTSVFLLLSFIHVVYSCQLDTLSWGCRWQLLKIHTSTIPPTEYCHFYTATISLNLYQLIAPQL